MTTLPKNPTIEELLRHSSWINTIAQRLVSDEAKRDDVIQAAWLRALKAPPQRADNLRGWFASLITASSIDTHRSDMRRRLRERAHASGTPAHTETNSAGDLVAQAELQRLVVDAVLGLPEPARQTMMARFFEGKTTQEIAATQGIPHSTVRNRIKRCLDELRERLDQDHDGDRRRWCSVMVPLAWRAKRPSSPTATALVGAMTLKNVAVALILLVVAVSAWRILLDDEVSKARRNQQGATKSDPTFTAFEEVVPSEPTQRTEASTREVNPVTHEDSRTTLLVGTVRSAETDLPIPDVEMALSFQNADGHQRARAVTGDDGQFRLEVAPSQGEPKLTLRRSGHVPDQRVLPPILAGTTKRDLFMSEGKTLRGRVVNAETGTAMATASVQWYTEPLCVTDEDGFFSVRGVVSNGEIDIDAEGFLVSRIDYAITDLDGDVPWTIPLVRWAQVTGRVQTPAGAPVFDATVMLSGLEEDRPNLGTEAVVPLPANIRIFERRTLDDNGITDKEGRFTLRGLGLSSSARPLIILGNGLGSDSGRSVRLEHPGQVARVDLVAGQVSRAEGQVTINGRPHSQYMEVSWAGAASGKIRSNRGGKFRIRDLPPGRLVVRAHLAGEPDNYTSKECVISTGSVSSLLLDLEVPMTTIEGTIRSTTGEPMPDVSVLAKSPGEYQTWMHTGEDGQYRLEVPSESRSAFSISARTDAWDETRENVPAGSTGVDFQFPLTGYVSLRVLSATTGRPLQRCSVLIKDSPNNGFHAPTGRASLSASGELVTFAAPITPIAILVEGWEQGYQPTTLQHVTPGTDEGAPPIEIIMQRGVDLVIEWTGVDDEIPPGHHVAYLLDADQIESVDVRLADTPIEEGTHIWNRSFSQNQGLETRPPAIQQHVHPAAGTATRLTGLAPGTYSLRTWPNDIGFEPAQIQVAPGEPQRVKVRFFGR